MLKHYLIKLKEEKDYTYEDIEEKSGIPVATIRHIFTGQTENPRLDTLVPLFKALDGSLDEMLKKEADMFAHKNQSDNYNDCDEEKMLFINKYIKSLERDKCRLILALCVLMTILIVVIFIYQSPFYCTYNEL